MIPGKGKFIYVQRVVENDVHIGFDIRRFHEYKDGVKPGKAGIRIHNNIIVDVVTELIKALSEEQFNQLMQKAADGSVRN